MKKTGVYRPCTCCRNAAWLLLLLLFAAYPLVSQKRLTHKKGPKIEFSPRKTEPEALRKRGGATWNLPAPASKNQDIAADSVEISDIQIEGNHLTKDWIIIREMQLKQGQRMHIREVDSLLRLEQSKIQNTELFVSSEVKCAYNAIDRCATLKIKVHERWYSLPMATLDIGDRNFNEWWTERNRDLSRMVYGFSFRHKNFRGRSERLVFSFKAGFRKSLRFSYQIPYVNRAKTLGLGFDLSYQTKNDVAYQTIEQKLVYLSANRMLGNEEQATVNLTLRRGFYGLHRLLIGYAGNKVADTVALANPDYFLFGRTSLNYWMLSYSFRHDRRDVAAYPLKGHFFQAEAQYRQGISTVLKANYAIFKPVSKRVFVNTDWMGKIALANRLPYALSEGLGYGKNFVRGYDLSVMDGNAALLCRNELKWKLLSTTISLNKILKFKQFSKWPIAIYPKAFLDAGRVWNQQFFVEANAFSNTLLLGGGIGLDIVTSYNLALRFEASRNIHGQGGLFFYWKQAF